MPVRFGPLYVAHPARAIVSRSLPAMLDRYLRGVTGLVAHPARSIQRFKRCVSAFSVSVVSILARLSGSRRQLCWLLLNGCPTRRRVGRRRSIRLIRRARTKSDAADPQHHNDHQFSHDPRIDVEKIRQKQLRNGANGMSDVAGNTARVSGRAQRELPRYNIRYNGCCLIPEFQCFSISLDRVAPGVERGNTARSLNAHRFSTQ
jgi:hypothetical protein